MRLAILLPLTLLLTAHAVRAEDATGGTHPDVLTRLESPARSDVAELLLASLDPQDTDAGVRLAHALGHAGGVGALPALRRLVEHRAEQVRLAAMEAAGRTRLRDEHLARRLCIVAREGTPLERRAAAEALGRVGDGRDMPLLLELARSEDARLKTAAFHALEALTGARLPFVHARWAYYWKSFRERAARLLPEVLLALEDGLEGPDRQALGDLVCRYGWVDVPALAPTLREWLVGPDRELRGIACRTIAGLRLAGMADEVRECLRYAAQREQRQSAREALDALGRRLDDALSTPAD